MIYDYRVSHNKKLELLNFLPVFTYGEGNMNWYCPNKQPRKSFLAIWFLVSVTGIFLNISLSRNGQYFYDFCKASVPPITLHSVSGVLEAQV